MPRYLFTAIALLIFLITFTHEISNFSVQVSPETTLAARRETWHVTVGRSEDGALMIREIANAPSVPTQARYTNHRRTLRAYVAPNHSGVPTVYLEAVRPRTSYVIEGAFAVLPDDASFTWSTDTTLMFYGRKTDGSLARFVVDVHDLSLESEALTILPSRDERTLVDTSI